MIGATCQWAPVGHDSTTALSKVLAALAINSVIYRQKSIYYMGISAGYRAYMVSLNKAP
jgi:hypothetical protein